MMTMDVYRAACGGAVVLAAALTSVASPQPAMANALRRMEGLLTAKSTIPTLAAIAPYREALAVYEWEIRPVEAGADTNLRVRVLHWIYYDGARQPLADWPLGHTAQLYIEGAEAHGEVRRFYLADTLNVDVEAPLYFDVGQRLTAPTDAAIAARAGALTEPMLQHRNQVRLLAFGDSRTARGLDVRPFYRGRAAQLPLAFNLAVAGSRLAPIEHRVRQCAAALPMLEWVVLNVSPRMLTVGMSGTNVAVLAGPPWPESRERAAAGPLPETHLAAALPTRGVPLQPGDLSLETWCIFEGMVRELDRLGINVLLWTPPMRDRSTGDDFVSAGSYRGIAERLRSLTHTYSRCHFVDLAEELRDRFEDADFADQDHLNEKGAAKLGRLLDAFREAPTWADRLVISATTPGLRWVPLRSGALVFADRGRVHGTVPASLLDLPTLQTRDGDRGSREPVVAAFTVDRPVRVFVACHEETLRSCAWLSDFRPSGLVIGEFAVWARDYPAGSVELGPVRAESRCMYTVVVMPRAEAPH